MMFDDELDRMLEEVLAKAEKLDVSKLKDVVDEALGNLRIQDLVDLRTVIDRMRKNLSRYSMHMLRVSGQTEFTEDDLDSLLGVMKSCTQLVLLETVFRRAEGARIQKGIERGN